MKSLFSLVFLIMLVVNLSVIVVVHRAVSAFQEEERSLLQTAQINALGDELRQSSDNLTKFARAYAVTGDPKWKQLFKHVRDVRNGLVSPPEEHDLDYWDYLSTKSPVEQKAREGISFEKRLAQAGMSPAEISALTLALNSSDHLTDLEEQAFGLIESGTPQGRLQALNLLYGEHYFDEKARIMNNIESAYRYSVERVGDVQASSAESVKFMSLLLNVSVITLVTLTLISAWMLWHFYLSPLENMQQQVIHRVTNRDYDFRLNEKVQGELGQFARAINALLHNFQQQLRLGRTVQNYNDIIRGKTQLTEVISATKQFISHHFNSPVITFHHYRDHQFRVIDSLGSWSEQNPDLHSLLYLCVEMGSHKVVQGSEENPLALSMGDMKLSLHEIHYFPIQANDQPLGVLQLGAAQPLTEQDIRTLNELVEALAIAFRLSLSSEKQRETEKEVTRQLELNQHIMDSIPNPTYYRNRLGEYLGVNDQFCTFFGSDQEEVLGKNIEEVFDEEAAFQLKKHELDLLQGTKRLQFELCLNNHANEPRQLVVYEAPFYDQNNSIMGVVGTFLDVTETKALEQELIEAKDAADKLSQIKGDFLANMSHEIRTPMNAIMGMTHLALETGLDNQQRDYIGKIESSSRQLLGIINDILDFSKIEAGKLEIESAPFKLNEVLDNLANILSAKADDKGVELIFNVSPAMPNLLSGDPLRLGQILINLVGNAVKFTEQGEVIVSVTEESREDEQIRLTFCVEDTGIGMTPDQVGRLFQAFSQGDTSTTRKYGGTGLGLTISRQLVNLMGGEIEVSSQYGVGSKFSFTLTLPFDESAGNANPLQELDDCRRALVVDDNDAARVVLASMLMDLQFDVDVAAGAQDAFKLLRDEEQPYDLLMIDWQMPDVDGIEAIEYIRRHELAPDSKIVLISAYASQLRLMPEVKALLNGVLNKPINASALVDTLVNCLGPVICQPPSADSHTSQPLPRLDDFHILLVEDNETNQEIAESILSAQGAQVSVAGDGLEALSQAGKHDFDLVLMDMQMPRMDGVTATRELRKRWTQDQLPILAMTANAMKPDIEQCLAAGMNDHIAKPIEVPELLRKIASYGTGHHTAGEQTITETPLQAEVPELDGIDINSGLKRLLGNQNSYYSALKSYLHQLPQELDALEAESLAGQHDDVRKRLHTLKGAAGSLAIDKVYDYAVAQEPVAKSGQLIDIDQLEELKVFVTRSQYAVNALCAQLSEKHKPGRRAPDSQFHHLLEELNSALQDSDTESLNLIEQLKEYQLPDPGLLGQMEEQLNGFRFDQAADTLNLLRRSL